MNSLAARTALVASLCLVAASCSDSDDPPPQQPPAPPVAKAGVDLGVWKGEFVTLDGSASADPQGDALTFQWRQTAGPAVPLSDERAARPSFVAPRATASLAFTLQVSDGQTTSAADEVVVAVRNRAPYAAAGADAVVMAGQVTTLDARGSGDPDGDPLTITWYQRSGPPVTLAAHPDGAATFVAPAAGAILEFGVVVSDGEASARYDGLRVQVVDEAANWPPVASAGPDLEVPRRRVVTLQGSAVDREYDPLTWTWTQIAGPAVALLGDHGPTPSFVAPAEDADLEFQLVVADAFSTGSDRVVVRVRNQPPFVGHVAISPAVPVTTDPLVASADVHDVDGDPLTVTWSWRRNGVPLAEGGDTLPAALTTRGDVFVVRVSASDGSLEGSSEATVTIADAPPVVTVSAPATARWGEAVAFTASAHDPDGDPVGDVVLLHGPAGMTVSATGAGAWTPTLPMFDTSMEVRFGVGVAGAAGLRADGVLVVEDATRRHPLRRSGIEIPSANGLLAADLDGDGAQELLVAGRTGLYVLARSGAGYAQAWAYPFREGGATVAAVEAQDLDGDRKAEIFFSGAGTSYATPAAPGVLARLDGASRRIAARADLGCQDLELADLDRDGAPDLVCLRQPASYASLPSAVVLDAATLSVRWESAALGLGGSIAVGNVDRDEALEIVAAGGYVFDGATGQNDWAYGAGFGQAVDTGDLDGDGVHEIVGMDSWSRFRGFSAVYRTPLWEQATSDNDALLVADVDGDGAPEIVVGDGQWGNVTAWRYRAATNDLVVALQVNSQDHGVTAIAVADLDGDGARELAWGSGASSSGEDVFVVAGPGSGTALQIEWRTANPSQLDGPFLGAKPARTVAGAAPGLLFQVPTTDSGYAGARLVRLDPASGELAIGAEIGSNWSNTGALDAVDYDGDGVDEAFVATANLYDGYLVAWDFAGGRAEWTSGVDAGDARAVTHADLNGDGAPELVAITTDGHVVAYDVAHGTLVWKSTSIGGGADVRVADVDGDGAAEIVALGGSRVVLFRKAASGPVPWLESASASAAGLDLEVADCDGDGRVEIYVLGESSVLRYDGALALLGTFPTGGAATSLFVEELGFARKNLVLGRGSTWLYESEPALEAVDPVTGARVWRSPPLWGAVPANSLEYVDLDADGLRAIAFGTGASMYLTR